MLRARGRRHRPVPEVGPAAPLTSVVLILGLVLGLSAGLLTGPMADTAQAATASASGSTVAGRAADQRVAKAPKGHPSKGHAHRPKVRRTATVTVRATVRRVSHVRVRVREKVTVTVVSRADAKGKPVGRATITRHAQATSVGRQVRSATAKASATASARGSSPAKALAKARAEARTKARARAREHAGHAALLKARHVARERATARARDRARTKARTVAKRRATRLARLRRIDPKDPTTWIIRRADHYTPHVGARFNNPYARLAKRRSLLTHVIRSIDSSPGYRLTVDPRTHRRLRCPTQRRYWPSVIRIAVYSVADRSFADAVTAANRRCVSIQVLMNSHLTTITSPSWGRIVHSLGYRSRKHWRTQRSFAHRCSNGCLGTSVLHSKIYLFSHAGRARHTVMTGSSNMTSNATEVQWNDLYTVNDRPRLYRQFGTMYHKMVPDHRARGPYIFRDGQYTSTFYPFRAATKKTDRTMRSLQTVTCHGARDGTGIHGRTVVYISMHAWFAQRGHYLARQVRRLYDKGCYVRVLYSFLAHADYRLLTRGTGRRMVVRRVLFAGPSGLVATKYSHIKMFAVSGHIGRDRSTRVVWTGSNNWVSKSLHADEVTLRIRSKAAYRTYVRHWVYMKDLRSSPYWASFQEPAGGGRAP